VDAMRLKVSLSSERRQIIDINYNYHLTALIYSLIGNPASKKSIKNNSNTEDGDVFKDKKYKLFCFSKLFPENSKVLGSTLEIRGKTDWYISSPFEDFLFFISNELLKKGKINIGTGKFNVTLAEVIRNPVFHEKMKFKSISPITVQSTVEKNGKKETISYSPNEDRFIEKLKKNLIKKSQIVYGENFSEEDIHISIDDEYRRGKGKVIAFKDTMIKCYQVPVTLNCDERIMRVAYDCGVGEKNPAGFGCLDIARIK
jgi:CRISPR-associated endoribonuclease Cas6